MPGGCSVVGCEDFKDARSKGVTFHHLPERNIERCKQWLVAIRNPHYDVNTPQNRYQNVRVCSQHFTPEDYERDMQTEFMGGNSLRRRRLLKPNAIPSIFQWTPKRPADDQAASAPKPPEKRSRIQMPLSSKEKTARHRDCLKNDPVARAEYLAKRKASYQKRKNEGRILKTPVSQLSKAQQEKTRQQWRSYQKKHRALDKIMNFKPESMNSSADDPVVLLVEAQPNTPDQVIPNMNLQDGEQPQASSTPEKERKGDESPYLIHSDGKYEEEYDGDDGGGAAVPEVVVEIPDDDFSQDEETEEIKYPIVAVKRFRKVARKEDDISIFVKHLERKLRELKDTRVLLQLQNQIEHACFQALMSQAATGNHQEMDSSF